MVGTDLKFYKASGDDGGAIGTDEIVDGVLNNLVPDISATMAETGGVVYRKFFIKNTNANDTAKNVDIMLSSFASGDDTVVIYPGTDSDTTSDMDESTVYGVAMATAELDRSSKSVTYETDGSQDGTTLFRVADRIVFVDSKGVRLASASIASIDASTITINEDIPDSIALNGAWVCNALSPGDMAPDATYSVWVRVTIPPYSTPMEDPSDRFSVATFFDA